MRWRIIPLETHDARMNMAIDEAICEAVKQGDSLPTIRFYKWAPSAVSIGCFQSMDDEVNVGACKELGIDCVRRKTGGGAVYHDMDGEITYSVIGPESCFPKGIRESYMLMCGWIISGLSRIGISAEFAPINDITVSGKKISGNAQTRRNKILLQHGTILYKLDVGTMFKVLKISSEKISDKMIKSVEERVTCVRDCSGASETALYEALLAGFSEGKEYDMGSLSDTEVASAKELASSLYGSDEWNFSR